MKCYVIQCNHANIVHICCIQLGICSLLCTLNKIRQISFGIGIIRPIANRPFDAIDKMLRSERHTIRPDQTIFDFKCVGQSIFRFFYAFAEIRNQFSISVCPVESCTHIGKNDPHLVLFLYITSAIKFPIFFAACSCICRVAWV